MQEHNLSNNIKEQPKVNCKRFSKADTKFHHEKSKTIVMHGYFTRKLEKKNKQIIDQTVVHHKQKSKVDIKFSKVYISYSRARSSNKFLEK